MLSCFCSGDGGGGFGLTEKLTNNANIVETKPTNIKTHQNFETFLKSSQRAFYSSQTDCEWDAEWIQKLYSILHLSVHMAIWENKVCIPI